jgi:predicted nucleic acid-binding protein
VSTAPLKVDAHPVPFEGSVPLLARCWELRTDVTGYDAANVALAEALDGTLLTADERLSRAPGIRCRVEVVA